MSNRFPFWNSVLDDEPPSEVPAAIARSPRKTWALVLLASSGRRSIHIPGGSDSEMDWTFYVPKVRHYIVLYGDAYAEDDILPIENPPRNPWHPGIYITHIPGIPKLDFHMEGVSTESPCGLIGANDQGCGGNFGRYTYYKFDYPDLNQSYGYLTGNTVGQGWPLHTGLAHLLVVAAQHFATDIQTQFCGWRFHARRRRLARLRFARTRSTYEMAFT